MKRKKAKKVKKKSRKKAGKHGRLKKPGKNGTAIVPVPNSPIDPLLSQVSNWVSDSNMVDRKTREALQLVAESTTAKLNLFRQVFGMKKAQRLAKLTGFIEEVEDRLFDPVILKKIKCPKVLVMIISQLQSLIKDDAAYVDDLVASGSGIDAAVQHLLYTMQVQEEQGAEMKKIKEIEPQKREMMRKIFSKLSRKIEQNVS